MDFVATYQNLTRDAAPAVAGGRRRARTDVVRARCLLGDQGMVLCQQLFCMTLAGQDHAGNCTQL